MEGKYTLQTTLEQRHRVDILASSGEVVGSIYIYDLASELPAMMQIPEPTGANVIISVLGFWLRQNELSSQDSSIAFVPVEGRIRVDAAVSCGQRLEGIAWISNCGEIGNRKLNFSLQVPKALGYETVAAILAEWIKYQNSK